MIPSACKLFTRIDDPRVAGRTTHGLAEILFAALCATLCGFGCCDGYAQFARAKVDFRRRYLPYQGGTPSHDTFGRLLRLIKPEQFEAVLADLAQRVAAGSAGGTCQRLWYNRVWNLGLVESLLRDYRRMGD